MNEKIDPLYISVSIGKDNYINDVINYEKATLSTMENFLEHILFESESIDLGVAFAIPLILVPH